MPPETETSDLHTTSGDSAVKDSSLLTSLRSIFSGTAALEGQEANPAQSPEEEATLLGKMEEILGFPLDETWDADVSSTQWPRRHMALCCLRTRKYNATRGAELFAKFVEWRRELLKEDAFALSVAHPAIEQQLRSGKIRVVGLDSENRVIVWIRLRFHDPKTYSALAFVRFFSYVMEQLHRDEKIGDYAQLNGVVFLNELTDVTRQNLDMRVPRELFKAFTARMPIRVGKILVVTPPLFLKAVLKIFMPFMSSKIKSRVVVVPNLADLPIHISKNALPSSLGGTHQLVDADVLVAQLQETESQQFD